MPQTPRRPSPDQASDTGDGVSATADAPSPDSLDAYDFHLPEELIALRPVRPRDSARLLVVNHARPGSLSDRIVRELPDLLRPGDVLVANDTRVIHARLRGTRRRGEACANIELLLHKPLPDAGCWRAFARPAKRLKPGDVIEVHEALTADVLDRDGGEVVVRLTPHGVSLDDAIAQAGEMPLPPYIEGKRKADDSDEADYQTVFARHEGSVAAPTAGLHFTDDLLAALDARGVARETVTLHVGAGTFLPVKSDTLSGHKMHAEWGEVTREVADRLNAARAAGGRIIAVGTTSMRLLESAVDAQGVFHPFAAETDIFITPGHMFHGVDVLMTNFHLPRSTLMVLVSAFAGLETMRAAYAHAIGTGYRFYSYGDSSLLFPQDGASPRPIDRQDTSQA